MSAMTRTHLALFWYSFGEMSTRREEIPKGEYKSFWFCNSLDGKGEVPNLHHMGLGICYHSWKSENFQETILPTTRSLGNLDRPSASNLIWNITGTTKTKFINKEINKSTIEIFLSKWKDYKLTRGQHVLISS